MVIEIDLHLMKAYELSLEEYVTLHLMNVKEYKEIHKLFPDSTRLVNILKRLVKGKFIVIKEVGSIDDPSDYKVMYFPTVLGSEFDKWFNELISIYPKIIRRPDGLEDNLLTNLPKCKELYKRAIKGNKYNHDNVIKCLKFQLSYMSRKTNGLAYMKKLYKWIEEEVWKDYEVMMEKVVGNNSIDSKESYGERIV